MCESFIIFKSKFYEYQNLNSNLYNELIIYIYIECIIQNEFVVYITVQVLTVVKFSLKICQKFYIYKDRREIYKNKLHVSYTLNIFFSVQRRHIGLERVEKSGIKEV